MFSGLIHARGAIIDRHMQGESLQLVVDGGKDFFADNSANNADQNQEKNIDKNIDKDKKLGASIAVNGLCLTIAKWQGDAMLFDLSPETLARTTANGWQKNWQKNQSVNLERSLRLGDELGGHLVFGHVDGVGEVIGLEKTATAWQLSIKIPQPLTAMMATKGSVAIDGCSLTINEVKNDVISISLIPHTINHTIAEFYNIGHKVNIEIDMLMRYVIRALKK